MDRDGQRRRGLHPELKVVCPHPLLPQTQRSCFAPIFSYSRHASLKPKPINKLHRRFLWTASEGSGQTIFHRHACMGCVFSSRSCQCSWTCYLPRTPNTHSAVLTMSKVCWAVRNRMWAVRVCSTRPLRLLPALHLSPLETTSSLRLQKGLFGGLSSLLRVKKKKRTTWCFFWSNLICLRHPHW